jgi:glycosyltransferase involved in cell wall biosynthesis
MLRVIHLVIALEPGGLERLVVDWTNARNRQQPDSTWVACLDAAGPLAGEVEGGRVHVLSARRGRRPWDRAAVRELRALLVRAADGAERVVIHSHNLAAQQYAVLAARPAGVRHVYTQHGANRHLLGALDRVRSRVLAALTDVLVAVSEPTAASMVSAQWLPRRRITVVPNGVAMPPPSDAAARAAARARCGLPPEAFVIGSVGRLDPVKAYDRLLRAFAALAGNSRTRNQEPGTKNQELLLLLLGDGPERARLESLARDLGIAGATRFAGFRPEARRLLPALDLFVLSSRSEGMPVALLEAMAAGVPAAVTDAGSCREVVDDGRAGFVLPADDSAWPGLLRGWIADESARRALARAGAARVRQHYSAEATLSRYETLYAADSNRGSGPPRPLLTLPASESAGTEARRHGAV